MDDGDRAVGMKNETPTDRAEQSSADCAKTAAADNNHGGTFGPVDKRGHHGGRDQLRVDLYRTRSASRVLDRSDCMSQDLAAVLFELGFEITGHRQPGPHS